MTTIETFNEFLIQACDTKDWEFENFPSVWGMKRNDDEPREWTRVAENPDPYDVIFEFVAVGMHPTAQAMLLMYGTMAKIDEDGDESNELKRVRVLVHLDGDKPTVAVQPKGEVLFLPDDGGEGLMPEAILTAINVYKKFEARHLN